MRFLKFILIALLSAVPAFSQTHAYLGLAKSGASIPVSISSKGLLLSTGETLQSVAPVTFAEPEFDTAIIRPDVVADGQYVYLFLDFTPTRFIDGQSGWPFVFEPFKQFLVVNANGKKITLWCWRSTNRLTGKFTVVVKK